MTAPAREPDHRPGLAVVSGIAPPYRVHLHLRLKREIPEFNLLSIFTRGTPQEVSEPPGIDQIRPIWLGDGRPRTSGPLEIRRWYRGYRRGGEIIDVLRANDVRALVVNGYTDISHLRALYWAQRRGIPNFLRGDSNILGDRPGSSLAGVMKRQLLSRLLARCSGIMPMGALGQEYFSRYGVPSDRLFRVPYEPDYGYFANRSDEGIQVLQAEQDLDLSRRYLLYSGRLIVRKRVDLLLDAYGRLADRCPDWDLLIAGSGVLADELEARVPNHLSHRVRWLGLLDLEGIRAAYQVASVLVVPSEFEPWALVVSEAMAAGCVVVASDVVGAANELVKDGVSGRVFSSGDLDELTRALADVIDSGGYERYRPEVSRALVRWREVADPVVGVRAAMRSVGLLP